MQRLNFPRHSPSCERFEKCGNNRVRLSPEREAPKRLHPGFNSLDGRPTFMVISYPKLPLASRSHATTNQFLLLYDRVSTVLPNKALNRSAMIESMRLIRRASTASCKDPEPQISHCLRSSTSRHIECTRTCGKRFCHLCIKEPSQDPLACCAIDSAADRLCYWRKQSKLPKICRSRA